jgi:hypothetical protein
MYITIQAPPLVFLVAPIVTSRRGNFNSAFDKLGPAKQSALLTDRCEIASVRKMIEAGDTLHLARRHSLKIVLLWTL